MTSFGMAGRSTTSPSSFRDRPKCAAGGGHPGGRERSGAGYQDGGSAVCPDANIVGMSDPSLGLERGVVSLTRHDPSWLVLGDRERSTVKALLGPRAVDVQHVGSTALAAVGDPDWWWEMPSRPSR